MTDEFHASGDPSDETADTAGVAADDGAAGVLRNDAEADFLGAERPNLLGLRGGFSTMDYHPRSSASTILLGVDGTHTTGSLYRSSVAPHLHEDIFTSLAELDEENASEAFLTSASFRRGANRNRSAPRWTLSSDGSIRNSLTNTRYSNETSGAFSRCLNHLAMVEPLEDSDGYPEPLVQANEAEDFEDVIFSTDWRTSCKGIQDRLKSVLGTERFADVYFYINSTNTPRSPDSDAENRQIVRRSSRVLSPRPPLCPAARRSTVSAQRRQNTEQQRLISSVIAQASDQASAAGHTTPTNATSDAEEMGQETTAPAEDRARTLTAMLLAMRDTNATAAPTAIDASGSEHSSPGDYQHSSSSPSDHSGFLECSKNTAIMCNLSDISDIDAFGPSGGEEEVVVGVKGGISANKGESKEGNKSGVEGRNEVKRFAAHRLILAIASPVFEAMFFGGFTEGISSRPVKSGGQVMEMHVTDVTASAFQQCLRYIYYDDVTVTDDLDDLYDTLYAAKKYLLTPLANACTNKLVSLMTPKNVLLQLDRCSAMDEDELFKICWHSIDVMTPEVLTSEHFADLERQTLLKLIRRDTLNCEEWELFEALMRWSQMECSRVGLPASPPNVARVMREFLPFIRFTTMSLEDFIIHVSKTDVLSLEAQRETLLKIATKVFAENDCRTGEEKAMSSSSAAKIGSDSASSAQKRTGPAVHKCRRFLQSISPTTKELYWSDTEYVVFQVSKSVFLAGIGLFSPTSKETQLKVKAEVRQCSLSQNSRLSPRMNGSAGGGNGANANGVNGTSYRSTGVSTLISGSSSTGHRHGQRHVGSQPQSYLRGSSEASRRRSHTGSTRLRFGSQTPDSLLTPSLSVPRTIFKSVKMRSSTLTSLETTLNCANETNRIIEARFSQPIKLKSGRYYVISVAPEEGRSTRCFLGSLPARSQVTMRTRVPPVDPGDESAPHSNGSAASFVKFDFAFGESSGGIVAGVGSGGGGDKYGSMAPLGEAPHVPYILFYPLS